MQLIVPIIAKINITCRRKRLGSFPHYKREAQGECSNLGIHVPNQLHMQRPLAVPKVVRYFLSGLYKSQSALRGCIG